MTVYFLSQDFELILIRVDFGMIPVFLYAYCARADEMVNFISSVNEVAVSLVTTNLENMLHQICQLLYIKINLFLKYFRSPA